MIQTWLRSNRRILLLATALPCSLGLLAIVAALGQLPFLPDWVKPLVSAPLFRWGAGGIAAAAGLVVAALLYQLRLPRLACDGSNLLVYVGQSEPVAIPLDVVECFFLGQGPSGMQPAGQTKSEAMNIIVRLAERAEEWKKRPTRAPLALWCDGYITLRGAWCEPISPDLLAALNHRLAQTKRKVNANRVLEEQVSV